MESSSSTTHRSITNTTTTTSSSSELFICFPSRNNSMKASSKSSILSPGRARDPPSSLPTSLSRRLRTSGSIKNGQASPMFPTGNKKRGSGFENPEPSSPKVTCIGQVRVKTKKQGKKMRNFSRRPSGEMSFRKMEHNQIQRQSSVNSNYHQQECSSHRNQRWVHLPLTICETLRGFGSEFSCLFPCKSSCFSGEKDVRVGRESGSSCVDVFAKWLVAVQDENVESGKRRDVELMVEDDDEDDEGKVVGRRHVFDEIEIKDYDEERGRVSICIPPKNALLLMRCRSDPVKMEALANRFWEPQLPAEDEEQEEVACYDKEEKVEVNLEKVEVEKELEVFEERRASVSGNINEEVEENKVEQVEGNEVEQEEDMLEVEVQVTEVISEDLNFSEEVQDIEEEKTLEEDLHVSEEVQDIEEDKTLEEDMHVSEEVQYSEEEKAVEDLQMNEEAQVGEQEERNKILVEEENESSFVTALEVFVNQESVEVAEEKSRVSLDNKPNQTHSVHPAPVTEYEEVSSEDEVSKPEQREQEKEAALEFDANESTDEAEAEKETQEEDQTQSSEAQLQVGEEQEESIDTDNTKEEEVKNNALVLERESNLEIIKKEERATQKTTQMLPDCLLLMMCEPKLSMEVSKETWVCSTDFIRWQRPQKKKPHAPPCQYNKSGPGNEEQVTEKRNSVDFKCDNPFAALPPPYPAAQNQPALQPARASCCLPAANGGVSMATMIEQKLVDAVAYEPFVLTRCKSEPMRTASKLATQEAACFWKNRAMEPHRRATFGVGAAGVGC